LGRFPSEGQVKLEAEPIILKDKDSPTIPYEDLEDYCIKVLQGTDFLPSSFEKMMKCFKVLDKKNLGYLKVEPFKQMIKKSALKYEDDEIKNMIDFLPKDSA
jgi:Ca2+-binding EF-hand superfamily protein